MKCCFGMQFVFISLYFLISWVGCLPTNPLRATLTPDDQRSFNKCGILLKRSVGEFYEYLKKIAGAQVYSYRQVQRIFGHTRRRMQTSMYPRARTYCSEPGKYGAAQINNGRKS